MRDNGPRYDHAAAVAAHIVNLLAGESGLGKAELFGKILSLVLDTIDTCDGQAATARRSLCPRCFLEFESDASQDSRQSRCHRCGCVRLPLGRTGEN